MPLSDHEQRLLEQMERALYQEDPKFATSLRNPSNGTVNKTRLALGIGGAVVGLLVVVGGVALSQPIIGVVGFAAMVGSAFAAWTGLSAPAAEQTDAKGSAAPRTSTAKPRQSATQNGFMDKMEERWRKRRDDDRRG